MTDVSVLAIVATFILTLFVGVVKYYERKYGTDPQAWDKDKFLLFAAVAAVVMAAEYFAGSMITFPAEEIITAALALFGTVYAIITGGKFVNNTVVKAVTGSPIGSGPKVAAGEGWSTGFVPTPSFQQGKSPFQAGFNFVAGITTLEHPGAVAVEIDWMDGTPIESYGFVNGMAAATHRYVYAQGTSKYTGHSFYPEFVVVMSDGTRVPYNVDGKACEVEVQSI